MSFELLLSVAVLTADPCDQLSWMPSTVLDADTDAAALCKAGNAVDGDLVVRAGAPEIPCLCEVSGQLVANGPVDVALPGLRRVNGLTQPAATWSKSRLGRYPD